MIRPQHCSLDRHDTDQSLEPSEVVGIPTVEIEAIGMGGSGDQEIGESASGLSSFAHHGGNDERVASCGAGIKRDRLEPRLDLLQPRLAFGGFQRRRGEKGTGREFCNRNR